MKYTHSFSLQWRHNGCDSISNHQLHDCLLNRLFRRRSKKTSKLRVTGLGVGNSPGTGEFPARMASNAENVSIWWRHHVLASSSQQNPPFSVYAPLATSLRPHHPGWVVDGGHYEWSRPHLVHSGQARVGSLLGAPSRCRPRRQSSRSHPAAHSSIGAGWTHCSAQHDRY